MWYPQWPKILYEGKFQIHKTSTLRSLIQGEANKRVGWNFSSNLISGEALITAGRVENFLKINKRGGSNNSGEGGKFPEN